MGRVLLAVTPYYRAGVASGGPLLFLGGQKAGETRFEPLVSKVSINAA